MPTEEEVTAALHEHAKQWAPDAWVFRGVASNPMPHTTDNARMIVKACLILGQPISDVLTIKMFLSLVERVDAIQRRIGIDPPGHPHSGAM